MCDFTKQSFDLNKISQQLFPFLPHGRGCLQYHTGRTGSVASFNWRGEVESSRCETVLYCSSLYCTVLYCTVLYRGETAPNMISGLSYNICLRQESGHCAVEWSTVAPHNGGLSCLCEYSIEMGFEH